ncbi:MAG: hypothetical protein WC620_05250 [Methanoregula sp.]
MEQLGHQDYRVTLISDGPQLIDSVRSGKPNLIICDTISFGQEAYEYCRQIKSDENLWMIPVMILTRASSLGDLLYILDGNADNFIAQPYDSPYLLSLVEGMLITPVERQTTDQIKTQFKIQHEGRVFVVTADRRKLLEFLMSAFEIAVKNSEDLTSAHTELQALSSRLTTLEEAGIENARLIGMLNTSVKNKEQDERTLKGELEETEQALDEKTAEAGQLSRALGDATVNLTAAEDHIRILLEEKETTAHSHQSETSLLAQQVSSHSQVIGTKTTELDAAQAALEEEKKRSAMLDLAVSESNTKKEQLETSLQVLTLEREHLASAFSQEKDRADAAEQETKSVLLVKAQSEEELTHLFEEMKDSARQQNDEHLRLKSVLESETGRCTSAEILLETLRFEIGQVKAAHELQEDAHKQQLDELQGRLDSSIASIFSQERELKILRDELIVAHAEEEKTAAAAAAVTTALNETRAEIEEREWKIQSLGKQIADAGIQKDTNDEKIRALIASLERVESALDTEKEEHAAVEERLNAALHERDETLQSVRGAHDRTKTDLDVHKNNLLQLNQDLEAATRIYSVLLADFKAASSRIDELECELNSVVQGKEQAGQRARSLSDDLERTKAELETERRIRRTAEVNLKNAAQVTSRLEGDIARSTAEQEALKATLAKEQAEHEFTPVKEARQQHDDLRAAKIQKLNQDFDLVVARQRVLEQQVKILESGKAAAEARADALADEIQQVRTALADEWEDHMNDGERLAATERKAVRLEQSFSGTPPAASERERKWAVVVKQADLPAEIRLTPTAVVVTHPPATRAEPVPLAITDDNQEVSPSLGIEDLFEDVSTGPGAVDRINGVSDGLITRPAAGTQGMKEDPAEEPEPADEQETGQEPDEDETGDQGKNLGDFMTTPSSYGISFNRQKWFDILKWSHHSGALSPEQRMQIVRMGRLIQNGRKLTKKQDEQVREMMVLVQSLGYRLH